MPLKNRTSKSKNAFDDIQRSLAMHGVSKVMFDYDGEGRCSGITFGMEIGGSQFGFKLPALVENVHEIMYGSMKQPNKWDKRYGKIMEARKEQSYKTAWANIRDWVSAQMALIDTKQVRIEQVFLPYAIMKEGKTLYEQIAANPSFLLGSGN